MIRWIALLALLFWPLAAPAKVPLLFLGTYGKADAPVEISEAGGALALSLDGLHAVPLKPAGDRLFATPAGVPARFIGAAGKPPTALVLGGVMLPKRDIGAETLAKMQAWYRGRDFDALRREARAATATVDPEASRAADLAEVAQLDPTIRVRLAYATRSNFAGQIFYEAGAKLYLQRPAAQALARAAITLRRQGYGLLLHDGYRPWHVTKMFWDAMPEEGRLYVANPARGSRHNRGAAIDLTLYDLKSGREVIMPSGVDEPAPKSYARAASGTSAQRAARDTLRKAMEAEGYKVFTEEWWHFDYGDWRSYPIMNVAPDAAAPVQARALYPGK
jgi:zinc D-Ala-D-Ala dipeptidase